MPPRNRAANSATARRTGGDARLCRSKTTRVLASLLFAAKANPAIVARNSTARACVSTVRHDSAVSYRTPYNFVAHMYDVSLPTQHVKSQLVYWIFQLTGWGVYSLS